MSVSQPSTILIMAGGTGGHVFPALAVAKQLAEDGINVVWLGTQKGIESRVVPEHGINIEYLTVTGLVGSGMKRKLTAPFMLLRALLQAMKVIRKHKPACVLGMGGFASGPGGIAAKLLRKPLIVHEQNAAAGLTNRKLANYADTVLSGFRVCEGLPENSIWVGNPVREAIGELATQNAQKHYESEIINVLVLGGSQGAKSLNEHLPAVLAKSAEGRQIRVLHQSGKGNSNFVNEQYQHLHGFESVLVEEFIAEMEVAYRWAHLVICRAGAMTITELMAAGRPAVYVPYPYSAGDHQIKNAKLMVNIDAAIMVQDRDISSANFVRELNGLIENSEKMKQMSKQAKQLYRPRAAKQVAEFCLEAMRA